MAKRGRKRAAIDRTEFEKLCELQCTLIEIAAFFGHDTDTIEKWCEREYGKKFSEVFAEKRCGGKISLRRKQFETALEGSVPMLIFLGKNWLAQSDRVQSEFEITRKEGKLADLIDGLLENDCDDDI